MSHSSELSAPDVAWHESSALYAAGGLSNEEWEQFEQQMAADPRLARETAILIEAAAQALAPTLDSIQQPSEKVRQELFAQLFPPECPADFLVRQGVANDAALVLADVWGQINWINPAFSRMCGYSLAELRGKKAGAMLQGPLTDLTTVQRIGAALRAGEKVSARLWNYHKDGTPYEVSLDISPLSAEGEISGFIAIGEEIQPASF